MTVDLDFEKATFHKKQRINYRFDAVAAVRVVEADSGQKTFELTLVNGEPLQLQATDLVLDPAESEEAEFVSQVTLDAAGLGKTLHILEGIAAEGKEWAKHEYKREQAQLTKLTNALSAIAD